MKNWFHGWLITGTFLAVVFTIVALVLVMLIAYRAACIAAGIIGMFALAFRSSETDLSSDRSS